MWRAIRPFLNAVPDRGRRIGPRAEPLIPIFAVGVTGQDRQLLIDSALRNRWELHFADTLAEALIVPRGLNASVIFCDRDLPDAEWRETVKIMASAGGGACIVLLSAVTDDYLREEVALYGGYDVLRKPLREDEVLRAVRLAWSYWNSIGRDR